LRPTKDAAAATVIVARNQAGDDAERRQGNVKQIVSRVRSDRADHDLAVDEPKIANEP
jgi:hypothetical protein